MDWIVNHKKEEEWAKVVKNKNQKGWKYDKFLSFVANVFVNWKLVHLRNWNLIHLREKNTACLLYTSDAADE